MTKRRRIVRTMTGTVALPPGRDVVSVSGNGDIGTRSAILKLALRGGTTERVVMGADLVEALTDGLTLLLSRAKAAPPPEDLSAAPPPPEVAEFIEHAPAFEPQDFHFAMQHAPGATVARSAEISRHRDAMIVGLRPSDAIIVHYRMSPTTAYLFLRTMRLALASGGLADLRVPPPGAQLPR